MRRDLKEIASDIKLSHSIFALPFSLLAAVMAAKPTPASEIRPDRFAGQLLLVIAAMVCARTAAMLANRLLDAAIDRDNPRTARRALPSGRLSRGRAVQVFALAAVAFFAVAALFGVFFGNWWPLALAAPVLAWICAYGYLKRFTAACHFYLGASLAISPLAAAIAIDPAQLSQPALWMLAGMVLCWVAGFDIIYALQDVEADRRQQLHSVPSRLGPSAARVVSAFVHGIAIALLWSIALGNDERFGALFSVAAALVTLLLLVEHLTVARWGTSRIALTFFTINGVVSLVVGALGIVDVVR